MIKRDVITNTLPVPEMALPVHSTAQINTCLVDDLNLDEKLNLSGGALCIGSLQGGVAPDTKKKARDVSPAQNALTVSRWKFGKTRASVPSLLRSLGIEYRKAADQDFWTANRFSLRALYREFLTEARDKMRDLHPDTGGDGYEFDAFIQAIGSAKKAFAWHLQTIPEDKPNIFLVPRRVGRLRTKSFYRHGKVLRAAEMLRNGAGIRATARATGMSTITVAKLRKAIPGVLKGCPCGQVATHQGWCSVRFRSSESRQQFMRQWHEEKAA